VEIQPQLREVPRDERADQLLTRSDLLIQRARRDLEVGGQPAGGERIGALGVQQRQHVLVDRLDGDQRFSHRYRMRCTSATSSATSDWLGV
jgi:hypothetical protein